MAKKNENTKKNIEKVISSYTSGMKLENIEAIDSFGSEVNLAARRYTTLYNHSVDSETLRGITEDPSNHINAKVKRHIRNIYDIAMAYVPCRVVTKRPDIESPEYGKANDVTDLQSLMTSCAMRMATGEIGAEDGMSLLKDYKKDLEEAQKDAARFNADASLYDLATKMADQINRDYENRVIEICYDIYHSISATGNTFNFDRVKKTIRDEFPIQISLKIIDELHALENDLECHKEFDRFASKVQDATLTGAQVTLGTAGSLAIGYRMIKGGISVAKKLAKLNQLLKNQLLK